MILRAPLRGANNNQQFNSKGGHDLKVTCPRSLVLNVLSPTSRFLNVAKSFGPWTLSTRRTLCPEYTLRICALLDFRFAPSCSFVALTAECKCVLCPLSFTVKHQGLLPPSFNDMISSVVEYFFRVQKWNRRIPLQNTWVGCQYLEYGSTSNCDTLKPQILFHKIVL